jgi:hypothetical protein
LQILYVKEVGRMEAKRKMDYIEGFGELERRLMMLPEDKAEEVIKYFLETLNVFAPSTKSE